MNKLNFKGEMLGTIGGTHNQCSKEEEAEQDISHPCVNNQILDLQNGFVHLVQLLDF